VEFTAFGKETKMKIDNVSPSVAPGHQPNVAASSGAEPPLQNVRPGHWASPAGPSTLTHKARYDANKEGKALVRWAINESKREPGASLPTKLADAFRDADSDVRQAMRGDRVYKKFVAEWASKLVMDAWNAPRTTIHRGDQAMRELYRVATALPPELAADLLVAATPAFGKCSKIRHDKDSLAIFSSNDRVPVSMPSPDVKASKPSSDDDVSKSGPGEEASKPSPEASKSSPNDDASQASPEASKPNPDPRAAVPKYGNYTYFGSLKAWVAGAEVPNSRQDAAIRQLEALIDKS